MLQRIRDGLHNRKWLAWLALAPIALIFSFWGGSRNDSGGASRADAATVDGEAISAREATKAWQDTQARWSQQFGTDIPAEQSAKMQDNILDNLVLKKVIETRLKDGHYAVSESRVLSEFQNIPSFKGQDGKFDPMQARAMLQQNGISEREVFDQTRSQLLINQLQQGLGSSYFLTKAEQQRLYKLENEEREVQFALLPADKFAGSDAIDDAAIKAYYDKNGDRFMTTESVALEYAELRLEQLATLVAPGDADLQQMYEDNKANYVLDERRRTRHILIPVTGDDDAGALKKAQGVLAEARAGKDFAELAKKYSTDITAKDGGELGFVEKKQFPGPFGDTLFGMKVGEIQGPVKSQFGYHLIKLEEIEAGQQKPFADVRAELDSQYRQEHAADLFGERQDQMNALIEKGEKDLDKVAKDLSLTRGSIPAFLRGGGAEPLGSGTELQQLVFGDATLNQGKIGGPLPIGEDRLVLVKVTAHHKAEVKPLTVVHDDIVALLKQERGAAAAKAAADAALPKLEGGAKLEALAGGWGVAAEAARFVSRGDPSIPAALRTAIFDAPRPTAKPVIKSTSLENGSAVFIVTKSRVSDTSANPQMVQQQTASLIERSAQGDVAAYVSEAKRKAKIVKNPGVFE